MTEDDLTDDGMDIISLLIKADLVPSRSEGRRAVEQGGVSVNGDKVTDFKAVIAKEQLSGDGIVLKRGKKKFCKVTLA